MVELLCKYDMLAKSIAAYAVICLILTCTITDLRNRKIYNWTTYSSLVLAIVLNLTVTILDWFDLQVGVQYGLIGIVDCMLGAIVSFVLIFMVYQLSGGQGAGDVKLATAIGAWLGVKMSLMTIFYTYIVAGVAVVCYLIITAGPLLVFSYPLKHTFGKLFPSLSTPIPETQKLLMKRSIPMAPFFAIGTLLALLRVFEL